MILEDLTITKWDIIKELSKKPSGPKELAEKIGSTTSNISQQLKLLEAQGYLNKKRIDQGKGSRKKNAARIIYSINQNKTYIVNLGLNTKIKEIQQTTHNNLIINLILNDLDINPILKFYLNHKKLFEKVDALLYLETKNNETHLLVITDQIQEFREKNSLELEDSKIIFWSHTLQEIKEGIQKKEEYFVEKIKKSKILYDKNNTYAKIK
ncbi:MAG: ArsR family transcriptional regulator [Candidatus Woesearchaeota archaeon]